MKRSPSDNLSGVLSLRVAITIVGCVLVPLLAFAATPGWWSLRGVVTPNAPANDYALANQGQLKNIAKAAAAEFDAHMPGGAGDALHTLINSWIQSNAQRNDFAPVNLGQLKNLAKPFYDRLITVRYADSYPWASGPRSSDDFAIANLGQVKNLFGFDLLATDLAHDSDQNGLPDWWEKYYFGHIGVDPNAPAGRGDGLTNLQAFQQGLSPTDYYSGQAPVVTIVSGDNQQGPPSSFLPFPFVVRVTDSAGHPLGNAPVTFTVSDGDGLLAVNAGGPTVATLPLRTSADGTTSAAYLQPSGSGITSHITVSATAGDAHAKAIFAATTTDGGPLPTITVAPSSIDEIVDAGQIVTRNIIVTNNSNAARQYAATLENSSRARISSTDSDHVGGPQFVWDDISAVGTHLDAISDEDEAVQAIDLSFAFPYFGDSYRKIYVSSNGFITVGNSGQQYVNSALPSPTMPANEIAAFHTDLDLGASGDVHYVDYGDRVVIQFTHAARYAGDGLATFQIVLKNDGTILFYYKELTGTIEDATVGVQDSTKQNGLTVAFQQPYLKNNLAVRVDINVERFSSFLDNIAWSDSDQTGGPAFVWDDISATGTHLNNVSNADDGFEAFNISFSFPYFNNSYSTVFVSSNGFVTLGAGSGDYNTYILPNAAAPANDIAAFQNDLNLGASGDVYYRDYGDHVVIQFSNAARYAGEGLATFQIVLSRDGTIFFYYDSMTGKVDAATVGVQNASKDKGVTIANRQHYLKSNLAVRINTNVAWLQVAPAAGSLAPGESANTSVTLNPRYLTFGKLRGRINITTDDPVDPPVLVPVTMTLYEPPTVSVVSPAANSISLDSTPLIIRTAVNAVTGVNRVEFYDGNTVIGQSTVAPFTFAWTQVTAGSHILSARVVDARNGTAISAAVPVQVLRDSDRNGLSDDWEMQFFGHLGESADGDFDHDGVSNADEYARGSDPTLTDGDNDLVPDPEDAFPSDPNKTMLPPKYALIDLGAGVPVAVSDSGLVAGNDSSFADLAFFWKAGTRTRLGTTANLVDTRAVALNDQGQVVGNFADPDVVYDALYDPHDTTLGFVWNAVEAGAGRNPWTVLTPPDHTPNNPNGSVAYAINNAGVVVGELSTESQTGTATRWTNGVSLSLGWGDRTAALAINSQGDIAGVFEGNQANGFADHGILNSVDLGVGFIRDLNDNRDMLWSNRLILADGQQYPELSSSGSSGQVNNAREVALYWRGAAFWKKHPKARRYDSFTVTDLVNPAALEELGLSEQNGLYLTAINNNSALAGFGYDDNGYSEAFLLLPVEMMVDGNRDGEMSFTDPAIHDKDGTTTERPYRFWLNDDDDTELRDSGSGDELETVPPLHHDFSQHQIVSIRNLEDFARLWIFIGGLQDAIANGNIQIGLKWKTVESGTPAINIYASEDGNGSTDYLTDNDAAQRQIDGVFNNAITDKNGKQTVDTNGVFIFRANYWNGLTINNPKKCLLFEGVSEGKGELEIVFLDQADHEIGGGGSLWLDLKNIKKLYERASATPDPLVPLPYNSSSSIFDEGEIYYTPDVSPRFEQPRDEESQCLVFVHGWRMSYDDSIGFSETMFKRLWWQGNKGRFVAFRWATQTSFNSFNTSEWLAWKYGKSLRDYVENYLKHQIPNYTVNIAAHSLGNVVTGSALKRGMTVNTYMLMQAAVPSGCYDDRVNDYVRFINQEATKPTPDTDSQKGYRLFLQPATTNVGKFVSFFNIDDYALATGTTTIGIWPLEFQTNWEKNQIDYKPDVLNSGHYSYDGVATSYFVNTSDPDRIVSDVHECLSFVARPRSKAAGAETHNATVFGSVMNLEVSCNFGSDVNDHTGQFTRPIQELDVFYKRLLDELKQ